MSSTWRLFLLVALALSLVPPVACSGGGSSSGGAPVATPPTWQLAWSTYLGGSDFEEAREPVALADGSLLFGARTYSADMPVTAGTYQQTFGGGDGDSWLGVMSADGSHLVAATYFGGSEMERPPYGIGVDPSGDVVFTSGTTSPDLPVGAGAWRTALHSPLPNPGDGYVARISADLKTLRWCTYTGGLWPRGGLLLATGGEPFVVGQALGANFTSSAGALQPTARGVDDAGILWLSSDGTVARYTTRLGGNNTTAGEVILSIRFAPNGEWLIGGETTAADFPTTSGAAQPGPGHPPDGFIGRVSADGSHLVFMTLLGGSGSDGVEHPIALLPDDSVAVTGVTSSADFPVSPVAIRRTPLGGDDGFLARLEPDGSHFAFVTRIGGSGDDEPLGPVLGPDGSIWFGGGTASTDFPVTPDALQKTYGGGATDGFLMRVAADGSRILYATYLGGSGDELVRGIAFGPSGELFAVGRTTSDNFPVTAGAPQPWRAGAEDAFVVKLVQPGSP